MNLLAETARTLAQAANKFPPLTANRPVAPATLFRWHTKGLRTATGDRVFLECQRIGRTFITSDEAVGRFIAALNPAATQEAIAPRSPTARERAANAASAKLNQKGVGV